jgi:hypothetical protein
MSQITDENEIVCRHYGHAKGQMVKGISCTATLYVVDDVSLPVHCRLVAKTEKYIDRQA